MSVFGKAYFPDIQTELDLPLFGSKIAAGFPSPATDYIEETIDLNKHLVSNPASTYYLKTTGNSMNGALIRNEDLLIVDYSVQVKDGFDVICWLEGEFTVKTFRKKGNQLILEPANPDYKPIPLLDGMDFEFYGVVTYSIHDCRRRQA
ncbi:translesion error-prone DNA polymerase V autoproteolytic subunit [Pontibacter sp. Tf4]|nr:translesion error-prone DNA polymerase V autoproteolytic subunit [Pontibacter sp. Tf4]